MGHMGLDYLLGKHCLRSDLCSLHNPFKDMFFVVIVAKMLVVCHVDVIKQYFLGLKD